MRWDCMLRSKPKQSKFGREILEVSRIKVHTFFVAAMHIVMSEGRIENIHLFRTFSMLVFSIHAIERIFSSTYSS